MPHIEPLKTAAKQDPVKHIAPKQGRVRPLRLAKRDPRARRSR